MMVTNELDEPVILEETESTSAIFFPEDIETPITEEVKEEEPLKEEVLAPEEEEDISELLVNRVKMGKEILDHCQQEISSSLIVGGKSLLEWKEELLVTLPKDTDDIKGLEDSIQALAYSIQQTECILATYELNAAVANNLFEEKYAEEYTKYMNDNKGKRIAADKIRQQVLSKSTVVNDILATTQSASLITEYFKRILRALDSAHRCIDSRIKLLQIRSRNT